jgi:hypothetical protein
MIAQSSKKFNFTRPRIQDSLTESTAFKTLSATTTPLRPACHTPRRSHDQGYGGRGGPRHPAPGVRGRAVGNRPPVPARPCLAAAPGL